MALSMMGALAGCGGGGSGSAGGDDGGAVQNPPGSGGSSAIVIEGSVGDGPVVNAAITVLDADGTVVARGSSDAQAQYRIVLPANTRFPVRIQAADGTDLVTDAPLDMPLHSVAMAASQGVANLNPFSTLIVELARRLPDGLNADNLALAQQIVLRRLSFGLDGLDPVSGEVDADSAAAVVRASEALAEALRRARAAAGDPPTWNALIQALASDLTDGNLDGMGEGADARLAALFAAATAQVSLEVLANRLQVNGATASARLDQAIRTSHPQSPLLTDALPATEALLSQARAALAAVAGVAEQATVPGIRINAGGDAYTAASGALWSADKWYQGGRTDLYPNPIEATPDDALYQTGRWLPRSDSLLAYGIPVENGAYTLRLHFAEVYDGNFSAGARTFDVLVEEQTVLDDFDIYGEVGSNTALVKSLDVQVADGQLDIRLLRNTGNPKVSAIEVLPAAGSLQARIDELLTDLSDIDASMAPAEIRARFAEFDPNLFAPALDLIAGFDADELAAVNAVWRAEQGQGSATPSAAHDSVTIEARDAVRIAVLQNDSGLGDAPISVSLLSQPLHGSAQVNGDNTITYVPDDSNAATDGFSYRVTDADGDMATASVQIVCSSCAPQPRLLLTWDAGPEGLQGYQIYYGTSAAQTTVLASDLRGDSGVIDMSAPSVEYNAFTDLGMQPGDSVCFRVLAYDQNGTSDPSEAACTDI